ncbi:DUF4276 family protein [Streptomyces sp. NPDC005794]|uniref:DUF4276 family protein n=1 Tax=Streptomyces sp. NPDC005794 TaxID=3364733 RepID=UPI003678AC7B
MTPVVIASVVEGDGEVKALPKLLHRIAGELGVWDLRVLKPMRVPRSQLVRTGGIEGAVLQQAALMPRPSDGGGGGVLVLLDADDDCPAALGPELLARARQARADVAVSVVLPCREYESWFLAAASSLAGVHGFPDGMACPVSPDEKPRDAKGWLTHRRGTQHPRYKPVIDQAPLTSAMDLSLARANSPSFDKLYRDVSRLLTAGTESR